MPNTLSAKAIQYQAPSEKIAYVLNVSGWVTSISGTPTLLKVVDVEVPATDTSATTVITADTVTVSGTNITLKRIQSLTEGKMYRVHVNFSDGTNTFEANFLIKCRY
mgnify:CR=1 FL=1